MTNPIITTLRSAAEICRAKDQIWQAKILESYAQMLERCPVERRHILEVAISETVLGLPPHPHRAIFLQDHTPYKSVSREIAIRLLLGETPAQISGGLTRSEAHAWLTDMPSRSTEWLTSQHGLSDHTPHDITVARWLCAAYRDPPRKAALERQRQEQGPHGETISGSYLERIDEIRKSDLRPSVEATFARATARLWAAVQKSMAKKNQPLAATPRWYRPARCVRLLLTPAQLAAEGKQLSHCVASYVPYVRSGDSVILALDVRGHRSTVEIARASCTVRQHRGPSNQTPHPLCERALTVLVRRWQNQASRPICE
jgi:hypothetical protein